MAYGDGYIAWFDALVAALVDADGPFTKAAQVELWCDSEVDELMPDERLIQALTRTLPHCLISWPAGGADPRAGGGHSEDEEVGFTIRYACGAPGKDYSEALKADGSAYWGAFAVHDFVLDQVFALEVNGINAPAELLGVSGIRTGKTGVLAMTQRWRVTKLRTYND